MWFGITDPLILMFVEIGIPVFVLVVFIINIGNCLPPSLISGTSNSVLSILKSTALQMVDFPNPICKC